MTGSRVAWLGAWLLGIWPPPQLVAAEASLRGGVDQVLVFDAGSSGTRIHIFNMRKAAGGASAHVPEIDLSVREKQTRKVTPGLSSYGKTGDVAGAQRSVQALLEFADGFVPSERRPSTPVLFKATAGLRALPEHRSAAVLTGVRETIEASEYAFKPEWAGIIEGKEEGGLAWLAANYFRGTFDTKSIGGSSLGVIEMGGGSTQVSFEVDSSVKLAPEDNFEFLTMQGRMYRVYAHSYLGFGQDYALESLQKQVDAHSDAADPCYPSGYFRPSPSGGQPTRGTGQALKCKAEVASMLQQGRSASPGLYAHEQPVRGPFIATVNFFYAQADAKLGLEDKVVTPSELEKLATGVCGQELHPDAEETEKMQQGKANKRFPATCSSLVYQAQFLRALHLDESGTEVRIVNKVNGGEVDWAVGAALSHYLRSQTAGYKSAGSTSSDVVWLLIAAVSFSLLFGWRKHITEALGLAQARSPTTSSSAKRPAPQRLGGPVE